MSCGGCEPDVQLERHKRRTTEPARISICRGVDLPIQSENAFTVVVLWGLSEEKLLFLVAVARLEFAHL